MNYNYKHWNPQFLIDTFAYLCYVLKTMIGILILANNNRVIIMYNTLYMFTIAMNLVASTHTYVHKHISTLCYAHNILTFYWVD